MPPATTDEDDLTARRITAHSDKRSRTNAPLAAYGASLAAAGKTHFWTG